MDRVLLYNATLLAADMRMAPVSHERAAEHSRQVWRCLVVSLGILVLTISLASRTVDLSLSTQTSVTSQPQKAKIQHRDRDAFVWAPVLANAEPFYLSVSLERVAPATTPVLSDEVDDCLYNRPPPLS
jgi:hypothetical protein